MGETYLSRLQQELARERRVLEAYEADKRTPAKQISLQRAFIAVLETREKELRDYYTLHAAD